MLWERESSSLVIDNIIVGLGNPGKQYENTRHNVGFRILDHVAQENGVLLERVRFRAQCTDLVIFNKRVLLMKPQTFMNNSGQSVVEAVSFYKVPVERVVVFVDDVNLSLGKIRIKRRGSDACHNGMKSLIHLLGQDTFPRVKIGIGQKPNEKWDLADWVLSNFKKDEQVCVDRAICDSYEVLKLILLDRMDEAMNKFNA